MSTPNKPRLDGFEFLVPLGKGGFGEVWLARDLQLQTRRAIKIVSKEHFTESERRRLVAEAQIVAQLPRHRNRAQVHFLKDGVTNCFLVMDYLEGGALSKLTQPNQPMPWAQAVRYLGGAAEGLLDVHAQGLLHRDIKPENLLWDADADEAVLADFGIAAALEQSTGVAGTRGYIAPEVLQRKGATALSDVFSLGASLLHLITGRRPEHNEATGFDRRLLDVLVGYHLTDEEKASGAGAPDAGTGNPVLVPAELRGVLESAVALDPQERPTLPRFIHLLREARWKTLAEQVLRESNDEPESVRLQIRAEVAPADNLDAFEPLAEARHSRGRLQTGDLVRLEARSNADGYHSVLLLTSSGELQIALPRPTAEEYFFAADQPNRLLVRLAPPAGTDRIIVVWTRNEVHRTVAGWHAWMERVEAARAERLRGGRVVVRGLELLGSRPGPAPTGACKVSVVALAHDDA